MAISIITLLVLLFSLLSLYTPSLSFSPSPAPFSPPSPPISPSPANSQEKSPSPEKSPVNDNVPSPAPEKSPESVPSPAPENAPADEETPAPAPVEADTGLKKDLKDGRGKEEKKEEGLSGGAKAGIVFGVIGAVCLVGFGAFVYKKRKDNIQRTEYGYRGILMEAFSGKD